VVEVKNTAFLVLGACLLYASIVLAVPLAPQLPNSLSDLGRSNWPSCMVFAVGLIVSGALFMCSRCLRFEMVGTALVVVALLPVDTFFTAHLIASACLWLSLFLAMFLYWYEERHTITLLALILYAFSWLATIIFNSKLFAIAPLEFGMLVLAMLAFSPVVRDEK